MVARPGGGGKPGVGRWRSGFVNALRDNGDADHASKDDTVLIFFAGHGAPETDRRGFERDGLAKYLTARCGPASTSRRRRWTR
jgi:uncharacterized caspase-like protein